MAVCVCGLAWLGAPEAWNAGRGICGICGGGTGVTFGGVGLGAGFGEGFRPADGAVRGTALTEPC